MKKIKLKKLDEVIYTDTCENGLQIYVWVNKKINTFQGTYVVNTGAEDVVFTIGKEKIHVPFGTHHYLEHMMCKMKDGSSLLDEFNKRGCYSNASTYPNRTIFEFVGSNNFNENLDLLLDAISNPTFNEEYFASERGPILEEARMRKDDVGRISLYGINECLFKAYPNRVTGLGNIEDIKKKKDALTEKAMALATKVYQQVQKEQGENNSDSSDSSDGDDVKEADYEEK